MQNSGDVFRGEDVVILYDPGEFPALLHDKLGQLQFRNGGVPQEGNLTRHLSKLKAHIDELVPDHNFKGEINT
jgi:hyaluronoglucosaminidase